MEKRNNSLRLW